MEITLIQQKIYEVRGFKVMLDFDLAELYGVETKVFNQAIKRNSERFPEDFMFQLTKGEWANIRGVNPSKSKTYNLRSQFVTSSWGGPRYLPKVFTEHGVTMLASVLRSENAVKMNIAIVRAFVALREMAMHYKELAAQIKELEQRYDRQFSNIYEALRVLLEEKQQRGDFDQRERIGFRSTKD